MIEIGFAAHRMILDHRGVLFWPEEQLLVVSDLHLGKGASLNRQGNPIPVLDTRDTIDRLAAAVAMHSPRAVVCLGDSFHDAASESTLQADEELELRNLIDSVTQWSWIVGNHDPHLPRLLPGERHPQLTMSDITLQHQPGKHAFEIVGHYHPKTSIRVGGRRVTGKCFLASPQKIVMPAFGSYTGGLSHEDPALQNVVGKQPNRYLIYRDRLWPIAAGSAAEKD